MVRRFLVGCSLAGLLLAGVPACGGGNKPVKTAKVKKKKKQQKKKLEELLADAREQSRAGEVDAADESYAAAYELAQEFDLLEERVDFLIQAGRATRAQKAARAYYDGHPADPRGYRLLAEALLVGGKGKAALEVADQMIALNEDDPAAHEKRGRALILLEKNQEGIGELRKGVQLDPDDAGVHLQLGLALHGLGEINEAALEFRAALKHDPENARAYVLLGMALRDQNELDESRKFLDKALELDSSNGRAYFELGLLLNRQGKQAQSEEALGNAVKYSPNESLFWYAYGEIHRLRKEGKEAIAAYRRAVDLDPPYPKAIGKLAQALVEDKQYDEAEAFLITTIRENRQIAINYLYLGAVYEAKGKTGLAIQNYQRYLDLAPRNDPDIGRAKAALRDLKRR